MTRTSSVAIVPRINGIRAIPPPGLSRSCMNVIVAGIVKSRGAGYFLPADYFVTKRRLAHFYYRPQTIDRN
eukprot:scaffold15133_cov78-Skeletonema_dohrnii-CCMP3373.AAC.1